MVERKNPYKNFRYLVEIDGIVEGSFSEVTIPDSTQVVIEYREGNEPITAHKQRGLIKYDAPDLKVSGNEIAIENIVIAHEGMKKQNKRMTDGFAN